MLLKKNINCLMAGIKIYSNELKSKIEKYQLLLLKKEKITQFLMLN